MTLPLLFSANQILRKKKHMHLPRPLPFFQPIRCKKGNCIVFTVIALDYYGCFWHGCPVCFTTQRHQIKLPRTGQSLEELWTLTKNREQCIKALGIEHITIWEHQFHELLRSNETANTFVKSLDLQERLNPRDAFYGG